MATLQEIHRSIDARVQAIRDGHPDWLCGKGCDRCCRSLADIPRLTEAEWVLLKEGLAVLPAERIAEITRNMAALADQKCRPVICPMLDQASGACPVYAYRPVACRTYGFYVQRDKGIYCQTLEEQAASGRFDGIIWGNHEAIERELAALGETRPLDAWFNLEKAVNHEVHEEHKEKQRLIALARLTNWVR